jgi:hypothetical protein
MGKHDGIYHEDQGPVYYGQKGAVGDSDTAIKLEAAKDGTRNGGYVQIDHGRGFTGFSVPHSENVNLKSNPIGLTVEVWLKPPDDFNFPATQENGKPHCYVHWLGKGSKRGKGGDQEWTLRFYPENTTELYNSDDPHAGMRSLRISAYVFNPAGTQAANPNTWKGAGASFQDDGNHGHPKLKPTDWMHIVATYDAYDPTNKYNSTRGVRIYKNGELRNGPFGSLPGGKHGDKGIWDGGNAVKLG